MHVRPRDVGAEHRFAGLPRILKPTGSHRTPEMAAQDLGKEATQNFLRAQFRRYYETSRPTPPDRFGRREFGFMFWTPGIVQRHLGFQKEEELRAFLLGRVPAHAYYSSAYYEKPDAPTMEEKGWLGADLIFDLDADHIPAAKSLTYEQMLEAVRLAIIKLWDRFLTSDLGFDERKMRLVFSGGRGYHIHVFDEKVLGLGTHERREIVDYITGKGLDAASFFKESAFDRTEFRGHVRVKKKRIAPAPSEPGWAGKIAQGLVGLTTDLETMDSQKAIEYLQSLGCTESEASEVYENLFKVRTSTPQVVRGVDRVRQGNIEALLDRPRDALIRSIISYESMALDANVSRSAEEIRRLDERRQKAQTDEPVTSDIKRLIRMPGSLHGKTGLRVVSVSRNDLDDFRPLRDAVPEAWTDEQLRMNLKTKITLEIGGEAFNLAPGVNDVPQFLAIFLGARGLATVVPEA